MTMNSKGTRVQFEAKIISKAEDGKYFKAIVNGKHVSINAEDEFLGDWKTCRVGGMVSIRISETLGRSLKVWDTPFTK